MQKRIFLALMLLFFAGHAAAWYNDTQANDNGITLHSDMKEYRISGGELSFELYAESPRAFDGELGVFFQDKDLGAEIVSVEALDRFNEQASEYERECPGHFNISASPAAAQNNIRATCTGDANGQRDVALFSIDANRIEGKRAITRVVSVYRQYKASGASPAANVLSPGRPGFARGAGYSLHVLPGENYWRITVSIPAGIIHRHGEFIVTLRDSHDASLYSILDPSWWEIGELTPDAHTLAMWHFNDNAGTTAQDAGTNNYDVTLSNASIWDAAVKKFGASSISPNDLYYGAQATIFDAAVPANWTVEAWVAPTVLHNDGGTLYETWFDRYDAADKRLTCRWNPNVGYIWCVIDLAGGGTVSVQSTRTSWPQDEWHFVQVIYDGTNFELRIDGVLEGTAVSANYVAGNTELVIGANLVYSSLSHFRIDEMDISDVDRNATPYATASTEPDVNIMAPLANTGTTSHSPQFVFSGTNADSCAIGFIRNGQPDYNTGIDFNGSGGAARSYVALENAGDEVYVVINHCLNGATDYVLVKKSAAFILYEIPLAGANPRNITNKDFVHAGLYGIYSLFAGIGASAVALILFILACLLLVFVAWMLTR